jgi:hypothetical protein
MKIVLHAPERVTELASEALVAKTRLSQPIFFRPLSSPRLYVDRIDLTIQSAQGKRTYPYKRADESVN